MFLDTGRAWLYAGTTEDLNRFKGYKSQGVGVYAGDRDVAQKGFDPKLRR